MRILSGIAAFVLLLAAGSYTTAATSEAETVTFADFTRINYISTSMSSVYFATTEGIIRYNRAEDSWEEPLTGAEGIDNRDVRRIWVDLFDEKLYIQTSTGPYEYDLLFREWFPVMEIPQLNVNYVHVRPPQVMHAPPGFLYGSSGYLTDEYGRDFYFNDIVDDRAGNLWIGTWGYGAAMAGSSSGFIELLPFGLIQNRVDAIYDDNGTLWVSGSALGGFRTGVTIFDVDANQFSHIESGIGQGLPRVDINCIASDDRYIYLGSETGLYFVDRDTRQVVKNLSFRDGLPDENVLALEALGDSLFVGTAGGLCLITGPADSVLLIRPHQFINSAVFDFEVTGNTVWIASSIGGFQLDLATGRLRRFQDPHAIVFNRVYSIKHYEGKIWLASDGGLVGIDLETGETYPYVSISRGFYGRALAVNDQVVATASTNGLTLYFLNEDPPLEREFTTQDGLPSNEIYELLLDGDYLWIGSDRGLTRFLWNDPDRID
ncbi:MAG: hypothetical protein JSU74_02685 [Candidatus Zixiibacteriota bacterium]|nr:MAG: hypothetical protein JSU74_02685 [candidate division Zixibacteria bacterium]